MAFAEIGFALTQYLKTASNGNIYYGRTGSGNPFMRCKKCSSVLVIGDMDYMSYGTDGTLDAKIQDYAALHRHVKVPEVSTTTLIPRFDRGTHRVIFSSEVEVPDRVKKTGRRFR